VRAQRFRWLSGAIAAALIGSVAFAEPLPERECGVGLSRETTERMFQTLAATGSAGGCTFEGLEIVRTEIQVHWSYDGARLPPVRIMPRECAPPSAARAGAFAITIPEELAQRCPTVLPTIASLTPAIAAERPTASVGDESDPLFRIARALYIAIALLSVACLVRWLHGPGPRDWRYAQLAALSFAAALAVRALLPFSLGNWYSEVLPSTGPPPWMRFGPGFFAWQSLLRDAGLWGPRALHLSQLAIGAAALPLVVAVVRELELDWETAVAASTVLVLTPFHARLSATSSEHVLASTLALALLACWLRAVRSGDRLCFALSVFLLPAVCMIRVDMVVQAATLLAWPFCADAVERRRRILPTRWRWIALVGLVAVITAAAVYQLIVVPSRHPVTDAAGRWLALRHAVPQFWSMATNDPPWIAPSAVILAGVGAAAMAMHRPLLLLRIVGAIVIAFTALGRSFMHDELVGARYFLLTLALLSIASGYGFASIVKIVPRPYRAAGVAVGVVGLALWTALSVRSAYAARYTFEDEYAFGRRALAELPAGCAVYQVPIRADALPADVDCCLDLRRSPLVLEYPALHFYDLPAEAADVLDAGGCTAYYEGAACAIMPGSTGPLGRDLASRASEYFRQRCAEPHRVGQLQPLARTAASPRSTNGLFGDAPPPIALYRWTR
jgi:hypothetical protein